MAADEGGGSRRRLAFAGIALLAVASVGGVALGLLWGARDVERPAAGDPAQLADEQVPAGPAELAELDAELGEPLAYEDDEQAAEEAATLLASLTDDAAVADVVAPGTLAELHELGEGVAGALPPGAVVVPQPETWLRRGNVAAMRVGVELEDQGGSDEFVVWLLRDLERGGWLISATELLPGEGSGP